jgi:hypothetical protein
MATVMKSLTVIAALTAAVAIAPALRPSRQRRRERSPQRIRSAVRNWLRPYCGRLWSLYPRRYNVAKRAGLGDATHMYAYAHAETLCGQDALRPWELGGIARATVPLCSPRHARRTAYMSVLVIPPIPNGLMRRRRICSGSGLSRLMLLPHLVPLPDRQPDPRPVLHGLRTSCARYLEGFWASSATPICLRSASK